MSLLFGCWQKHPHEKEQHKMCLECICMLAALFLLNLPAVQSGGSVTYSSTQVCRLKGTSVHLPCRYEYSWVGHYMGGGWYKQGSRRVSEHSNSRYPDCSLTINTLSNDHSGVYHFQFYTFLHRSWITGAQGIRLTVTDVEVKEVEGRANQTTVNCSMSCSLGSQYVWYKTGQPLQDKTTASILVSEVTSYSCAVKGYEDLRSPAVCVPDKKCWDVTYSSNDASCVLLGSSVDIPCTYLHPKDHSISTTFWFNKQKCKNQPKDLSLDSEYENHVEYLGNKESDCTLRLKDLRGSHSGEYAFSFKTKEGGNYTGLPGVNIFVTALQVLTPKEVTEDENVIITCNTTCMLSNNPTFIWYKNGQPVTYKHTTKDNKLHLNPVSSEDAGSYSCAVRGHDSLPSSAVLLKVQHKPKSVSVHPSDGVKEGASVTLTCSSDANPPVHTYTWYMKSGAESLVRGTGESISFNVTSDTSGLYYCEAQNEVGSQNSTEVAVPSKEPFAMILPAILTTLIILAVLLMFGIVCLSKKKAGMSANTRPTNATAQSELGRVHSSATVRATTSDLTQRVPSRDQDNTEYTSIQEVPLYSTAKKPQIGDQDNEIAYASVQFYKGSAATRAVDDGVIYSTVLKP